MGGELGGSSRRPRRLRARPCAVAAGGFGFEQRPIGAAVEGFPVGLAREWAGAYADARRNGDVERHARRAQSGEHGFGFDRFAGLGEDCELLAADPRDQCAGRHRLAQSPCEYAQHLIAAVMADRLVTRLK